MRVVDETLRLYLIRSMADRWAAWCGLKTMASDYWRIHGAAGGSQCGGAGGQRSWQLAAA